MTTSGFRRDIRARRYSGNSADCPSYGTTTYTYDADNVRRTKKTGGKTTTYYYEGSRLLAEKQGNTCRRFIYDHNRLTGLTVNGEPFLYEKNVHGDITGIYDVFGVKVASYAYDAWGKCTVYASNGAVDTSESSVGNTNPIRYRGYYYDRETNLYYLINRYYDPETGRFISPDHIGYMVEQMEALNGCNLFAYCLNNPVMGTDPEGTAWWQWLILGIGAVIAVGVIVAGTVATGGMASAVLVGAGVGYLSGAGSSIVAQGSANNWDWKNIDAGKALGAGLMSATIGAITGAASFYAGTIGQYYGVVFGNALSHMRVAGTIVGSVFNPGFLMSAGQFLGRTIGEVFGGAVSNEVANNLFGRDPDTKENIKEGAHGALLDIVLELCRWILK